MKPAKPPKISEAQFLTTVIAAAKALGYLVHHQRPAINRSGKWSSAIQGHRGLPDLILAKPGVVLFIELKSEAGKLTPEQERWAQALEPWWFMFRPSQFEALEYLLRKPFGLSS